MSQTPAGTAAAPTYEWDVAEVGDAAPPKNTPIDEAVLELYTRTSGDHNPLYSDEAFARSKGLDGLGVPVSAAVRVAPGRRATIMRVKGYAHPVRPTPCARWQCETFGPMKVGDVITVQSFLDEKYEKRGRKYLVWRVEGRNQRGELVVVYRSTNVWEGAKPGDRTR